MSFTAGIEVTRACNFRCRHCFVDAGRPLSGEMGTAELKALLEAFAEAGATTVGWSGGEPLLRKDLDQLTRHARSLGLQVTLVSNGFFASRARLQKLAAAGVSVLQISLDGPDAARAERYRLGPKGSFERAVQALRDTSELGMSAIVCALLSPETAGELDEMLALSRSVGASALRYTVWNPVGRAKGGRYDERAWAKPAMRRFLEKADALARDLQLQVIIDCPTGLLPGSTRFTCHAGRKAVYVCATGEIYPCTALMTPEYLAGNVRETPVKELLRAPQMFKVHRQILREPPGGACGRCGLVDECNGGCPGRALSAFGSVRGGARKGEAPACLHRLHDPKHRGPRLAARR